MQQAGDTTGTVHTASLRAARGEGVGKGIGDGKDVIASRNASPASPASPASLNGAQAIARAGSTAFGGLACAGMLIGWIAGIAFQLQEAALHVTTLYVACTAVGLTVAIAAWTGLKKTAAAALAPWLCIAALALTAYGSTGWRAAVFAADALAPALEGRDIDVTGTVTAMPQRSEDAIRFRLRVESARLDGQAVRLPPSIALGWYAGFGGAVGAPLTIAAEPGDDASEQAQAARQPQNLRAGERWQMTVRLKAPHGNSNPHGFDYELWLWEQGLQATGYVRAGRLDAAPSRLTTSWRYPIERARQAAREAIYARVSDRQIAGIVAALVVGDQNAIERADWDVFRATGVAHLMSISGLHITMFAWLAARLVGGAWRRSARVTPRLCFWLPARTAGALCGLALATLYAVFSGWGVPAQRTICMLATLVLLSVAGRRWPWTQTWLLAMAVVLAFDPWALMQAGFWLSFVAVGMLFAVGSDPSSDQPPAVGATNSIAARARIYCANRLNGSKFRLKNALWAQWLARSWQRVATPVAGSLGRAAHEQWIVTLALTPLSLLLFNQVSVIGLLANALAIPWVTLVVTPLAMGGLIWPPLWDGAAAATQVLATVLKAMAAWPWASINVPSAPLLFALAGVLGGGLLALRLPWRWRVAGLPLLLPVLLWQTPHVAVGQFELLAADIGQGNAVLVRTASHALLYDTGPRFSRESDAGHRVLVPLLRAIGEPLDILVLSHRDSDHIGGAEAVLAMQPEGKLLASIEDSHPLQAIRKATRCSAGQHWEWDGVQFEILHPLATDYDSKQKSNAMSCVLRISNGTRTALLTGDIEAPQELRLVALESAARLKADVLLVPHHGSKTSSTGALLDAVQPQFALVQAGYRNRFGHPVASVLARYEERGIQVIRSPSCGALTWQSSEPAHLSCQRMVDRRYWHHVLPN